MPKLTLLFDSETLHHYFKELKLKDEECEKLSRVRNELEAELEELTASLFQVCKCNNSNVFNYIVVIISC